MNFKRLFSLSILVLLVCFVNAKTDSTKIKRGRVLLVSSGLVATLGGSYLYVENKLGAVCDRTALKCLASVPVSSCRTRYKVKETRVRIDNRIDPEPCRGSRRDSFSRGYPNQHS